MISRRRRLITSLVIALALLGSAANAQEYKAQQLQKMPRIGYLSAGAFNTSPDLHQAFREALRDLGWIEGQNILVEERWAEGHYDRLQALAAEVVKLQVQVIVAISTAEIRAAKQATSTIPIVMVIAADPVADGLIESVRRPGGNITGTAFTPDPAIVEKYIEFLREMVPGLRQVGQLIDRGQPDIIARTVLPQAALKQGLTVQTAEVGTPDEIERAFALITEAGARGVLFRDPAFSSSTDVRSLLWRRNTGLQTSTLRKSG